ncbi:MAG: hypothetical protein WBV94_24770 [Blastocatellia bacterium]
MPCDIPLSWVAMAILIPTLVGVVAAAYVVSRFMDTIVDAAKKQLKEQSDLRMEAMSRDE